MQVRDGMSAAVLTVGPGHTIREATRLMAERKVGAAIVRRSRAAGPGILTERDVVVAIGRAGPRRERVAQHLSASLTFARPSGRSSTPPRRWSGAASATSWS